VDFLEVSIRGRGGENPTGKKDFPYLEARERGFAREYEQKQEERGCVREREQRKVLRLLFGRETRRTTRTQGNTLKGKN